MILTPNPLHRRTAPAGTPRPTGPGTAGRAAAASVRPVLHSLRVPQQLCLDLQPRAR
jgi:hypothetical protein